MRANSTVPNLLVGGGGEVNDSLLASHLGRGVGIAEGEGQDREGREIRSKLRFRGISAADALFIFFHIILVPGL